MTGTQQTRTLADGDRYRKLVDSIVDYAVYMLDPDGFVASWNSGAVRFKGYSADEIVGQHFSRFYTPEDQAEEAPGKALAQAMEEGRFEAEGWRVRKDGTRMWAHVVIDAIVEDDGTLLGFAKITRDITQKKLALDSLQKAREALFQTQKLEAVGRMTGGVAHNFNNLLTVIFGSLDMIAMRAAGDRKILELTDLATRAAERGASLTQRMLAFASRQEIDRRPVDIPDFVRGMGDMLQRSLGPTIAIEYRFPLALPKVMTDANHLESALLNLAVNSRDAMPGGGPLVISAREERLWMADPDGLRPGHYVCFSVKDRGTGMDEETLSRAAEPFFTTKGVGEGSGLGLSSVQGLAARSGGRLRLKSRKGKGTTAEIWLPVAEGEDLASEVQEGSERSASAVARPLSVFAVDDDPLVLMSTAAMLGDLGYSVTQASSGKAALEALRGGADPDVIVTDHAMPEMTGAQLIKAIRAEWPGKPVILATGYADLPDSEGADVTVLSKPFSQKQLAEMIETVSRTRGQVVPFGRKEA